MIAHVLLEYCLNAMWLAPLVACSGWLTVQAGRLRPAAEHRVWLAAFALCLALPVIHPLRSYWAAAPAAPRVPLAGVSQVPVETLPMLPVIPPARHRTVAWDGNVTVDRRVLGGFVWIYSSGCLFKLCRFLRSASLAHRLRRAAHPYEIPSAEAAAWGLLGELLKVHLPEVLSSERVSSPVVVGLWHPAILLPEGFDRLTALERRAVLCHELAHVKRRDCLVHTLVRLAGVTLFWHPAVLFVLRRIERTREIACDELAAKTLAVDVPGAPAVYARCLLHLARRFSTSRRPELAAAGLELLRTNKLEERVMRLIEEKRTYTTRELWTRRLGGVALAGAVLAIGGTFHLGTVLAQNAVAGQQTTTASATQTPSASPAPRPAAPVSGTAGIGAVTGGGTGSGHGQSGSAGWGIAHGKGAHVMVRNGKYLHRWIGADGESYELQDDRPGQLTPEQERAAEAEYRDRMQQAQQQLDRAGVQLGDAQMAKLQAEMAAREARLNSPEFKAELEQAKRAAETVDTPEFRKKMAVAERQMKLLESPDYEARMNDAAKRLDEASARIEAAAKALEDARQRLQQKPIE